MKNNKVFSFLRSMRFGMILLCAIAALSVVGTLVTQGQTAAFYPERYGNWGNLILFFGFDHMYATWYYVALFAALCLNLLLCSVLRFGKVRGAKAALIARVQNAKPQEKLDRIEDIQGVKTNIEWGAQIRSYVFMPYTLVKDTRTGFENGNVAAVMDGDLDGFINAYLKMNAAKEGGK